MLKTISMKVSIKRAHINYEKEQEMQRYRGKRDSVCAERNQNTEVVSERKSASMITGVEAKYIKFLCRESRVQFAWGGGLSGLCIPAFAELFFPQMGTEMNPPHLDRS